MKTKKEYKYYLVYQISNDVNNKLYIGRHATNNKYDSYMGSGNLIKKAIKKYGIDHFTKDILYECVDHNDMIRKEYETIKFLRENNVKLYNLSEGEINNDGKVYVKFNDEEYKKHKSEMSKKMWQNEEYSKNREILLNDENFHNKLSDSAKRRFEDSEEHIWDSNMVTELWKNEEYRNKVLEARRISNQKEETHKNRSESRKRVVQRPEVRKSISEGGKRRFSKIEERKKQSERITLAWKDPVKKQKLIDAFKGRIWIKNIELDKQKQVFPEDFENNYKKDGWVRGKLQRKPTN